MNPKPEDVVHIDFESRSRVDLRETTAYRYAEDDSTEILMAAVRKGHGPTLVAVNPKFGPSEPGALELLREAILSDALLAAHNRDFEHAMSRYKLAQAFGLPHPSIERWRCTAAMCRNLNFPASLEQACAFLNLPVRKSAAGKALIDFFSKPREDGTFNEPADYPKEFAEFIEYCRQDVNAECALYEAIHAQPFDTASFIEWGRINDDGFPVNVAAAKKAWAMVQRVREREVPKFAADYHIFPTQRARALALLNSWLDAAFGVSDEKTAKRKEYADLMARIKELAKTKAEDKVLDPLKEEAKALYAAGHHIPDMRDETLDAFLTGDREAVTTHARASLLAAKKFAQRYSDLQGAAVSKLDALLRCVNRDGRVRGCLVWSGTTTGRAAAKLVQPQNFKRPVIAEPLIAFAMIRDGASEDDLSAFWEDAPLTIIGSTVRNYIGEEDGTPINDADYAAVEARGVCWLAGQHDAVRRFVAFDKKEPGAKEPYCLMAEAIFRKPVDKKTDGGKARFVGKTAILGAGYGCGKPKFLSMCHAQGAKWVDEATSALAIDTYRDTHDKVRDSWREADKACHNAIENPGVVYSICDGKAAYRVARICGVPCLQVRLPSGRRITYPRPRITSEGDMVYYCELSGGKWGESKIYAGLLIENIVQGLCSDLIDNGLILARAAGVPAFLVIHDQALCGNGTPERLATLTRCLETLPAWAKGFPLKAAGDVEPFYLKS